MGEKVYILGTDKADQWEDVLHHCVIYDIYHLPGYHRLEEEQSSGEAHLFVFESESALIAMPFLIRRVKGLPGIDSSEFFDATSVYGYPGPISNVENPSDEIVKRFGKHLYDYFKSGNVIAAFSRLNPLLKQEPLLRGFDRGEIINVGPTVAIDLRLPLDEQYQKYRSNHKRDINKAKREGITCIHDESWTYLDAFIDIYYDTMRYRKASEFYFFDRSYFSRLRELLEDRVHLFIVLKDRIVLAGGLFTICNGIIEYHLGATNPQHRKMAPSKLMFDTVRLWGHDLGAHMFHLGGGVGGKEDSLYYFKAGFSNVRYTFKVWRAIIDAAAYEECVRRRRAWEEAHGRRLNQDVNFFPAYRVPTTR